MSFQHVFSQQIHAFGTAVLDDCERASRPEQSDTMVLRLRNNALALAKVQLAMVAIVHAKAHETGVAADQPWQQEPAEHRPAAPGDALPSKPAIVPAIDTSTREASMTGTPPVRPAMSSEGDDHLLTGDTLSRFVSSRLQPDESPHEVWQRLQDADPAKPRRNPALPRARFRSSPG